MKTKNVTHRVKPASALAQKSSERLKPGSKSFPIVGIGASAGGLEAITQLLKHLPSDTGMALILVQHLDPKHKSKLTDLLSRVTSLPVSEVTDGVAVKTNHIYVMPPDASMVISNHTLHLIPRPSERRPFMPIMPIDRFLRSLAEEEKSQAIGIILSGTASDGTLGLKTIKAEGGITFAQDASSAKYDGMPRSAVAAGCVDFILSPEMIARELARLSRHSYVVHPQTPKSEPMPQDEFYKVLEIVRKATGADFIYYKHSTVSRRISRRMALCMMEHLKDYLEYMRENPAEAHALYQDLLIHVTSFFRNGAPFEALKKRVLPAMTKAADEGPIQVWVPGCSTGEEAYTIAICLQEFLEDKSIRRPVQIFGTDISEEAIIKARAGVYAEDGMIHVSPERLKRFFTKTQGGYQIRTAVRELCIFAKQDITRDPPFSKLDLISCRNLLIFLGPVLHSRAFAIFHYALKPTGFLMLGISESSAGLSGLFECEDKKYKVYSRKQTEARLPWGSSLAAESARQITAPAAREPRESDSNAQETADRIALARFSPAGVLINQQMDVLQFRGHTGAYLEPAPGKTTNNLLKMAREGLPAELRVAVQKSSKTGAPVRKEGLRVKDNRHHREVSVEVIPIPGPSPKDRHFLVFFEEALPDLNLEGGKVRPGKSKPPVRTPALQGGSRTAEPRIRQLERELAASHEYLQAIIEEQEATNEELETAKEELQSGNEELTTLNEGLQRRNMQLGELNDDLNNVLRSIDIPLLIVQPDLRIRLVSPASGQVLNVIPSDAGRPLNDIRLSFADADLSRLILEVIATGSSHEQEIRTRGGRWYSLRILPYRTSEGQTTGAVVVFVDVDAAKQASEMLQQSHHKLETEVAVRTAELAASNKDLQTDIIKREAAEQSIRDLSNQLMITQDEERRRLARELHDSVAQTISAVALNLGVLGPASDRLEPQQRTSLSAASFLIEQVSNEVRNLAYLLHPPILEEAGVSGALREYLAGLSARGGIHIELEVSPEPGRLPQDLELAIFRVVQESLSNITRHSGSLTAHVRLSLDSDKIRLEIRDQGKGIPAGVLNGSSGAGAVLGVGIRGMRERARQLGGILELDSTDAGTTVRLVLPLARLAMERK